MMDTTPEQIPLDQGPMIEKREIKAKELEFTLTEGETAKMGKKTATLGGEILDLENRFQSVKKDWKARIEGKKADFQRLLTTILSGKEVRTVDCEERRDYNDFSISYWVNEKMVETRPMTHEERQPELPEIGKVLEKAPEEVRREIDQAFRGAEH